MELQDIRHEMEELQDQFRLDDADEFRQLQAELEIAAKNCRILQFKLRKLEKRNESLESEKILLQGLLLLALFFKCLTERCALINVNFRSNNICCDQLMMKWSSFMHFKHFNQFYF